MLSICDYPYLNSFFLNLSFLWGKFKHFERIGHNRLLTSFMASLINEIFLQLFCKKLNVLCRGLLTVLRRFLLSRGVSDMQEAPGVSSHYFPFQPHPLYFLSAHSLSCVFHLGKNRQQQKYFTVL